MTVASTFRRIMAHSIDEMIGFIFAIPLLVYLWRHASQGNGVLVTWKWLLGLWIAKMTYETLCIYVLQALPAQHFFGLKIMSTHRPELGLGLFQSFLRVLMGQLKYIFGPSIYFMALFHRDRQHLGDIIAETKVVQFSERTFEPKIRFILGSILVYFTLVANLSNAVEFISSNRVKKEGIIIETPQLDIHINGWNS